jgi:ABC-type multidrug transport system fused ATPase/permease subunit
VEVVPTAHYFMGGVVCRNDTSTELPGLFVAGEDASGMHGANRLGGNGVANSTVFGGIAGDVMPRWITANPGLRTPDAGVLLLRGLDRSTFGISGWRRRVTAAPQFHENHVLSGSFAYNLLLGREWPASAAQREQARALCSELGLGELVSRMPSGLDELIGETGWQLSHGEKSRLYIARTLLQGVELVILDESFASLDPETMRVAVRCVLDHAPSVVVVSHP